MSVAISKNGVPIRLTEERWFHIVENHDEMAGFFDEVLSTAEDPDFVIQGYGDAVIALRGIGKKKFMAAVYKEIEQKDGFVITAPDREGGHFMGKEILSKKAIEEVFKAMPHILKLPAAKFWFDYDREADVLYISFQRPQKATDSEMLDDGVILRYRGDEMVGLTILDASKRNQQSVGTSKSN